MYPSQMNAHMDSEFGVNLITDHQQQQPQTHYSAAPVAGQQLHAQAMLEQQQPTITTQLNASSDKKFANAYVKIVEQPANKALRFRYECEGRSAGSIPGLHSTATKKTYPTIEIVGYRGRAIVVVSCVTKDAPHRPHPHNLVGKEGCKNGVCTLEIKSDTMRLELSSLGIQCVKKRDIEASLKAREDIRVDPFKTGFSHRFQPASINLNAVRLCFQVFIEGDKGRFTVPLKPVVSEPIYDKKAMLELVIHQMCSSATVLGKAQILLLCEKVVKEDIAVRFFEEKNGVTIWQAFGDFQPSDVHKQTSIRLRTPRYRNIDIVEPVKVFVQLQRPSDGVVSEPWEFKFEPHETNTVILRRKCQRLGLRPMEQQPQQQKQAISYQPGECVARWNVPNIPGAALEPSAATPATVNLYGTPAECTPPPEPLPLTHSYNRPNMRPPCNKLICGNIQPLSTHQQYQRGAASSESGAPHAELTPITVEKHNEHGACGRNQQRRQHPPQPHYATHCERQPHPPPHQHQTQHFPDNRFNNANAGVWEEQFANVLAFAAAAMSNINGNSNQVNMQNLLAATAPTTQWNFPFNQLQQQQPQQPLHYQPQQQYQPMQTTYQQQPDDCDATLVNGRDDVPHIDAAGGAEGSGTLSNLLNLDSDQLMRVNGGDQPMFRLTTDELQLSNLSISV